MTHERDGQWPSVLAGRSRHLDDGHLGRRAEGGGKPRHGAVSVRFCAAIEIAVAPARLATSITRTASPSITD